MARATSAFDRFYRDNVQALRSYAAKLLPNVSDADDVANEAFMRVLAASTAERPVPPRAYLFSAAHNLAMNLHRRQRVRGGAGAFEDLVMNLPDPTPSADRDLIGKQRLALLWEVVNQLPPRTRDVFIMRKVKKLSNFEIAERLEISVSAVEKHILKGVRACKARLDFAEGSDVSGKVDRDGTEGGEHG